LISCQPFVDRETEREGFPEDFPNGSRSDWLILGVVVVCRFYFNKSASSSLPAMPLREFSWPRPTPQQASSGRYYRF
jgi:hypothetical protein